MLRHEAIRHRVCFIFALFLTLGGCSTAPCTGDPLTDSAACATKAISSGVYELQTTALQNEVDRARAAAAANKASGDALSSELSTLTARRQRYERQLTQLDRQIALLAAEGTHDERRIQDLKTKSLRLKLDLNSLVSESPESIASKEEQIRLGIKRLSDLCDETSAGRVVN